MSQAQSVSRGSPFLGTLAVGLAAMIVAFVIAGEFSLGYAWSLIATALPVLAILSFERMRATYSEWKFWFDCNNPAAMDIESDARIHVIIASAGFFLTLTGAGFFYARGNPWWIAGFIVVSIICLLLGPVEDEPQGE